MTLYDNEENAVVNNPDQVSETPSDLVAEGEGKELSPNPANSGFVKQLFVDSLPASGQVNTLYLLSVKNDGALVGHKKYKWNPSDGWVFCGVTPDLKLVDSPREQKAVQVNAPRVLYDKNGLPVVTLDDDGDILTVVNGKWQKQTPTPVSGGTKLFRHSLVFGNDDEIIFINNIATPYTFDNLQNLVDAIYYSLRAVFHNETDSADQVIMTAYLVGDDFDMAVFDEDSLGFTEVEKMESDFEHITDIVTEL